MWQTKEKFPFFVTEICMSAKFPRKSVQRWHEGPLFWDGERKIPRKLFEFMTSWVSLLLYLKFREAGNEAGDVRGQKI